MKTQRRDHSIVTAKSNLEPLKVLPNFPVFIGATSEPEENDVFADMNWHICPESGVIQLNPLLPNEVVYSEYHSEAVGQVWDQHRVEFAAFCAPYLRENVLEIGGSNGKFADLCLDTMPELNWTILEPTPSVNSKHNIKVIQGYFEEHITNSLSTDVIVHSHVLEHVFDPRAFLHLAASKLEDGQYQVFSVPNLKKYLLNGFSNTINFEHTILLEESCIDYLLSGAGFKVLKKHYFDEHSIFYATVKDSSTLTAPLLNNREENASLYLSIFESFQHQIENFNRITQTHNGPVYVFGAHIFSQFLIYLGLNVEKMVGVLDNSLQKVGKRLYGTTLNIFNPQRVASDTSPLVIVKAGQYQQEVKTQLLQLNPNTTIVE